MTSAETNSRTYDLAVLGGGNAVALAIRAAKAGQRVAVIEADLLGGACPNRGCIPSKLLLGYAEVAHRIRQAGRFHIDAELRSADIEAMRAETQSATIDATDGKIEANLPESLDLYRGRGRFVGERALEVNGVRIEAEKVVIGTGSRPRRPEGLDEVPYWTSDEVFEMDRVPRSIAIVGGGYIACELAFFFASVGVETTMLVRSEVLLPEEDEEIREVFREGFTEAVSVRFGTTIASAEASEMGVKLALQGPEGESSLEVERLLYAIGRVPNSDGIGLESAGVETDKRGNLVTDRRQQTTAEGVFALGDVTGRYLFTHAAAWEATYLGDCLLEGREGEIDYGPMPHAVFSAPEVAGVGEREDDLRRDGRRYVSTSLPFRSAAKGRAVKEEHGLAKFLLSPEGEILGCHIVGHEASVLLHQVLMAMRWRNHISSLTDIIYIHPSLSEVVRNAARKAEAALR